MSCIFLSMFIKMGDSTPAVMRVTWITAVLGLVLGGKFSETGLFFGCLT